MRVVRQANAGMSASRNRGIASSDSEYIALLDSDDVWHPQKIERQLDALAQRPDAGLCFTGSLAEVLNAACNGETMSWRPEWRRTMFTDLFLKAPIARVSPINLVSTSVGSVDHKQPDFSLDKGAALLTEVGMRENKGIRAVPPFTLLGIAELIGWVCHDDANQHFVQTPGDPASALAPPKKNYLTK